MIACYFMSLSHTLHHYQTTLPLSTQSQSYACDRCKDSTDSRLPGQTLARTCPALWGGFGTPRTGPVPVQVADLLSPPIVYQTQSSRRDSALNLFDMCVLIFFLVATTTTTHKPTVSKYLRIPPSSWNTSLKPMCSCKKGAAFSHRTPPVQYITRGLCRISSSLPSPSPSMAFLFLLVCCVVVYCVLCIVCCGCCCHIVAVCVMVYLGKIAKRFDVECHTVLQRS